MLKPIRSDGKRPARLPRLTIARCHLGDRLSYTSQLDDAVAPLVPRALPGDVTARDALLRACHATVYRWGLVDMGDPDDADDVAQEVLVRLATRVDRYAGRSRFTTWLYQVTRNTALGFGRRLASGLRLAHKAAWHTESVVRGGPAGGGEESQRRAIVMELFRELAGRQRGVVHLTEVEGVPA